MRARRRGITEAIGRPLGPVALRFGQASTDVIVVTNPIAGGVVPGFEYTYAQWVRQRNVPATSQGTGFGLGIDLLVWVPSYWFSYVGRDTTGAQSNVTDAVLFPTNTWTFVVSTYSEADGVRIYRGTPTTRPVEVVYDAARTIGAGSTTTRDPSDLWICNRGPSSTGAPGHTVAAAWLAAARLTLPEIWTLWRDPRFRVRRLRGRWFFGEAVGSLIDTSGHGNRGVITGTTRRGVMVGTMPWSTRPRLLAPTPDHWFPLSTLTADGWLKLQVGGTPPADSTLGTGWNVGGVAAGQYARMEAGVVRATTAFSGTAQPSGGPDNTLKDCWRSDKKLTVDIPSGTWTIPVPFIASAEGQEGAGCRVRVRLWRSANADGSTPTEITSGASVGSTVTNLQSEAASISTVTVALGALSWTAQYLFLQVALETV